MLKNVAYGFEETLFWVKKKVSVDILQIKKFALYYFQVDIKFMYFFINLIHKWVTTSEK